MDHKLFLTFNFWTDTPIAKQDLLFYAIFCSLIALLLFKDFRKAFETVDAKLLFNILFHYGFDNLSIKLLSDYFSNRAQVARFGNVISGKRALRLGVPQGSVFGPLLFILFINDMAYIIALVCKLFVDDTTLYAPGKKNGI